MNKLIISIGLYLLVAGGTSAYGQDNNDRNKRGRELYETVCTQCHTTNAIEVTRDGRHGWEDTVHKMVSAGAQIDAAEMEIVIDYLASRFGPGAGPMETGVLPPGSPLQIDGTVTSNNLVLPDGEGKALVQGLCQSCHDLGRVVSTRNSAADWQRYATNMLSQNDLTPAAEQVQAIVAYLTRYFGANP